MSWLFDGAGGKQACVSCYTARDMPEGVQAAVLEPGTAWLQRGHTSHSAPVSCSATRARQNTLRSRVAGCRSARHQGAASRAPATQSRNPSPVA